jgi:SAM-dependent methyltransferase
MDPTLNQESKSNGYEAKLNNYQSDCPVLLGYFENFSDYIKQFSKYLTPEDEGLDIGAGPKGPNSRFFKQCKTLDGCDASESVVGSLSTEGYRKRFVHVFGSGDLLPYVDKTLDFVVCSCVIQHLKNFEELEIGIKEISRVLKCGGLFYLMFKAGTNDTELIHTNEYYNEVRTFRVFDPKNVTELCKKYGLDVCASSILLDSNWIPYSCMIFNIT